MNGFWAGSLDSFDGGSGYWFARTAGSEDVQFQYNAPGSSSARSVAKALPEVPEAFRYAQSTEQGFYFVESITQNGEAMTDDNWILAYNNGVVVGARMWSGEFTDIPAMGKDSSIETAGYMESGGTPSFKLYNAITGLIVDLYVEGSIDYRKYTDKTGVEKYTTDIKGYQLQMINSPDAYKEVEGSAPEGKREVSASAKAEMASISDQVAADDIPF